MLKKFITLVLGLTILLSTSVPAFAAINDSAGFMDYVSGNNRNFAGTAQILYDRGCKEVVKRPSPVPYSLYECVRW